MCIFGTVESLTSLLAEHSPTWKTSSNVRIDKQLSSRMTHTALQAAREWLSQQHEVMVDELIQLANLNSGSHNLVGLRRVAEWLTNWMALDPANCETQSLPARMVINDRAECEQVATSDLLLWHCRPEAVRRVLLGIHYDTVYGSEHSFQKCTRLTSDRLRGPGVADAKGGIIVLRYALQAVERFSLAGNIGWTVFLNPDEEVGSPSSSASLRALASQFECALLFEPALPNGAIVSQRKGSGLFTIIARGRAAHAGRDFNFGRNAVVHLASLIVRLGGMRDLPEGVTINVGHFLGGGVVNVVPDTALARINVRVPDLESQHWVDRTIRDLVKEFNNQDGLTCELFGGFHAPPKLISPAMKHLMDVAELTANRLGQQLHWTQTGGVSDGNRLAAAGLPTLDTLGPLGDCLHSANEWVSVGSLLEKSMWLVEMLYELSNNSIGASLRR